MTNCIMPWQLEKNRGKGHRKQTFTFLLAFFHCLVETVCFLCTAFNSIPYRPHTLALVSPRLTYNLNVNSVVHFYLFLLKRKTAALLSCYFVLYCSWQLCFDFSFLLFHSPLKLSTKWPKMEEHWAHTLSVISILQLQCTVK